MRLYAGPGRERGRAVRRARWQARAIAWCSRRQADQRRVCWIRSAWGGGGTSTTIRRRISHAVNRRGGLLRMGFGEYPCVEGRTVGGGVEIDPAGGGADILDGQEGVGHLHQGDAPVTAVPGAHLVVGHAAGGLAEPDRIFYPPSGAGHQHPSSSSTGCRVAPGTGSSPLSGRLGAGRAITSRAQQAGRSIRSLSAPISASGSGRRRDPPVPAPGIEL
jgi:hypothetical protein